VYAIASSDSDIEVMMDDYLIEVNRDDVDIDVMLVQGCGDAQLCPK
jgi:hypothetical protein